MLLGCPIPNFSASSPYVFPVPRYDSRYRFIGPSQAIPRHTEMGEEMVPLASLNPLNPINEYIVALLQLN